MNANTNQPSRTQFQWHAAAALLNAAGKPSTAIATAPIILNNVHFIKDVNGESTLRAVQQALQSGVEFCIHNESTASLADQHKALKPKRGKPGYLQCMSSGSSGHPKRIRRTHLSWINSFQVTTQTANLASTDSYAIIGKLSHSLTLYAALEAVWIGADVHALSELRPDKQLSAMAQLKSSVLYATPTQLRMLCGNTKCAMKKNSWLRHIYCGGGKLDKLTLSLLKHPFPNATVKEFYGASETSFITISDNTTPIDSVGQLYPSVQLKIMSVDSNADNKTPIQQPAGCTGDIWVKSPYLFEHYGNGFEHDTRWHNGYLCIGEMGYLDEYNHLYLTGRRSRMVNVADNMVFPEQIENLLYKNTAVRHCAVIPIKDKLRGSVLIAVVELNGAVETLEQAIAAETPKPIDGEVQQRHSTLNSHLLQSCREQLGTLKAPREIIFTNKLPMLASGKPDLQAIEKQFGDT